MQRPGFLLLETFVALIAFGAIAQAVVHMYSQHVFTTQRLLSELEELRALKKDVFYRMLQPGTAPIEHPFKDQDKLIKSSLSDVEGSRALRGFRDSLKLLKTSRVPLTKNDHVASITTIVIAPSVQ